MNLRELAICLHRAALTEKRNSSTARLLGWTLTRGLKYSAIKASSLALYSDYTFRAFYCIEKGENFQGYTSRAPRPFLFHFPRTNEGPCNLAREEPREEIKRCGKKARGEEREQELRASLIIIILIRQEKALDSQAARRPGVSGERVRVREKEELAHTRITKTFPVCACFRSRAR